MRACAEEIQNRLYRHDTFPCATEKTGTRYLSLIHIFYLSNNYTLSAIFGRDLLSEKAKSERLSHMTELVLGYLLLE